MEVKAVKHYKVYEISTGELLVSGGAEECAAFIGISKSWFREAAKEGLNLGQGKYQVEVTNKERPKRKDESKLTKEAIQKWDDFVTPIRERYGIPVYKAKPEVRG